MKNFSGMRRFGWSMAIPAMAAAVVLAVSESGAQTRQALFDGKTLSGWHTQGAGIWTVADGRIHASNPQKNWAHLVTDKVYKDGYARVKILNVAGNTGLYVRGAEGGDFGVKGMQIDFGFAQDGSVMRVTDTNWAWIQLITKAVDSAYLKKGDWNELGVDVQGASIKTYINGKPIWSGTNVAGIAASGVLALQLHNGDNNDVYFKDIDLFLPTRIPYCPVPTDPAFKSGNDPDSALCKNPVSTGNLHVAYPAGPDSGPAKITPGFWFAGNPSRNGFFNALGLRAPFPSIHTSKESGIK